MMLLQAAVAVVALLCEGAVAAPPGKGGGGGTPVDCPTDPATPTDLGGIGGQYSLTRSVAGTLCILSKIAADGGSLIPVGRSYDGGLWEAPAGDYSGMIYACDDASTSCEVDLGGLAPGETYVIKMSAPPPLSDDNTVARFLGQATFGYNRQDLASFEHNASPGTSVSIAIARWVQDQMYVAPTTSHREYFRQRANARFVWPSEVGLATRPCSSGTRFRRYAFSAKDYRQWLTVNQDADTGLILLSIYGKLRTVVTAFRFDRESTYGPILPDASYEICGRPEEYVNGGFRIRDPETNSCQYTRYGTELNWGNPPVMFNASISGGSPDASLHLGDITDKAEFKDTSYFWVQQELILNEDISGLQACDVADGINSATYATFDGLEYIHDARLDIAANIDSDPLVDGGGSIVERGTTYSLCANAPRTFLNEDGCELSLDENACGPVALPTIDLPLTHDTMRTIFEATTDPSSVDEDRYVYAIEFYDVDGNIRVEGNKLVDPPCEAGKRSRWIPVADTTCPEEKKGLPNTQVVLAQLLSDSSDTNPYLRDIIFPTGSVPQCDVADAARLGFQVQVGTTCWQNVHPDHMQIFDFTYWSYDMTHPGNSESRNPIKEFAEASDTTLLFPDWHDIGRWERNKKHQVEVGRKGDIIKFRDLPEGLRTDTVAKAFGAAGAVSSGSGVMVCGSPGEVATEPDLGGSEGRGGFDVAIRNRGIDRRTTFDSEFILQRETVWLMVVMTVVDQLRQRVAWALSQILVIAPDAINAPLQTEIYLQYYDIFVRNAFGNFFDVLKEVSYSPMMAEMLTYYESKSTAYVWANNQRDERPDENYAREVMQLFSIGFDELNDDGTKVIDPATGKIQSVYTNEDIEEYARAWTGFGRQEKRGNIEMDHISGGPNRLDPMYINLAWRDWSPKMGLNRQYVGDRYPLCADRPAQHYLKKGARYRLLGVSRLPELHEDPTEWAADGISFALDPSQSVLYERLCNPGKNSVECSPFPNTVVLDSNLDCRGVECDVDTVRVVQVIPGVHYEYVSAPCVEQAFYGEATKVVKASNTVNVMCADPRREVAAAACCEVGGTGNGAKRSLRFYGERVSKGTAESRCSTDHSNHEVCMSSVDVSDDCDSSGSACANDGYYWTTSPCTLRALIKGVDGEVAIVHEDSGADPSNMAKHVQPDTKTFFRVDWSGDHPTKANNCLGGDCQVDQNDRCLCKVTVEETAVFGSMPSREDALLNLKVGGIDPEVSGTNTWSKNGDGVTLHTDRANSYIRESVFEVTDENGVRRFLKNVKSEVVVMGTSTRFRNPVHFISLTDGEVRDAQHETTAVLEHYFFHQNTAAFLALRFCQRFGISNPSPSFVSQVSAAFRQGSYTHIDDSSGEQTVFGVGKYGDLAAVVACVLLHKEARNPILDADPAHGAFREPILKVISFMKAMEFHADGDKQLIEFIDMTTKVGQAAHRHTSVFSYFLPEYQPPGPVALATLVGPEAQQLTAPKIITSCNGLLSLVKWGLNKCYDGFGNNRGGNCYRVPGDYGYSVGRLTYAPSPNATSDEVMEELSTLLTAGRMSDTSMQVAKAAYEKEVDADDGLMQAQQLFATSAEFHTTGTVEFSGATRGTVQTPPPSPEPYKAVVYIIFSGGYDSYNMLVPHANCSVNEKNETVADEYEQMRGILSLLDSERIPIDASTSEQPCKTFAIHHELPILSEAYNDGDCVFFANTGLLTEPVDESNYRDTATQLFAHNTMQEEAKRVDPFDVAPGTGILGRMTDELAGTTGTTGNNYRAGSISIDSATIATIGDGNVDKPPPIIVSKSGAKRFDPGRQISDLRNSIKDMHEATSIHSSFYGESWSHGLLSAITESDDLVNALESAQLNATFENDDYSRKLDIVSRLIQTHDQRGTDRDVFYIDMGGWDHHSNMKNNLANRFKWVEAAFRSFMEEMKAQQRWHEVTLMVTSEFARTLDPNNGQGSDHAWGGNYMMLGGNVKGKQIMCDYPSSLLVDSNMVLSRGRVIPTCSWETVLNPVCEWMGVTDATKLDAIMPNRNDAVETLYTKDQVFDADGVSTTRGRKLRGA